jgi:hypothetical protein
MIEPELENEWYLFSNQDSNFNKQNVLEQNVEEEDNYDANNSISNVGGIPEVGLHWEYGGEIDESDIPALATKTSTVKQDFLHKFRSPIDSFFMMCPICLWEVVVLETNRYADQKLKKLEKRKPYIAGYKWVPVSLQDIMTYYGVLIYGMLYPQTGRRLRDYWESPYLSPWTKFMSRGRFLQRSFALHFNNNDDVVGMENDGLHKIRPILNILKTTLGKYANLGSEHSLDEATMACRSSYGRHLITFNAKKTHWKIPL